jgi:hypothetical protein
VDHSQRAQAIVKLFVKDAIDPIARDCNSQTPLRWTRLRLSFDRSDTNVT